MRTLKMICTAAVLTMALSMPGTAGEITTPGLTATDITAQGVMPAPGSEIVTSSDATLAVPGDAGTPALTAILLALSALI